MHLLNAGKTLCVITILYEEIRMESHINRIIMWLNNMIVSLTFIKHIRRIKDYLK